MSCLIKEGTTIPFITDGKHFMDFFPLNMDKTELVILECKKVCLWEEWKHM